MALAGFGERSGLAEQVNDKLEAVFLLLRDAEGRGVVLGGVDTLFLTEPTLDAIRRAHGDLPEPVVLFATHTHSAPSLAPDLPLLGRHDAAWNTSVTAACGRAIRTLATDKAVGVPVTVRYGERPTDLNVNRRKPAWVLDYPALLRERRFSFRRCIALAENPRGVIDRRVRAVFLEDEAGVVRAVVWSLAAHPVAFPDGNRVSADFPGQVRRALRQRFGEQCAVVYLPGLAGSARPRVPRHLTTKWKEAVAALLPFWPSIRSFTPGLYRRWVDRLVRDILDAYGTRDPATGPGRIAVSHDTAAGVFRGRNPGATRDLHLTRLRLAPGLEILGCTGEPTGAWENLIGPEVPDATLRSGYLAGPAFYMPTSPEIREGGYEVTGFQHCFGCPGDFDPDISGRVLAAVRRLYRGRPGTGASPVSQTALNTIG
jgi:hypothetical protein